MDHLPALESLARLYLLSYHLETAGIPRDVQAQVPSQLQSPLHGDQMFSVASLEIDGRGWTAVETNLAVLHLALVYEAHHSLTPLTSPSPIRGRLKPLRARAGLSFRGITGGSKTSKLLVSNGSKINSSIKSKIPNHSPSLRWSPSCCLFNNCYHDWHRTWALTAWGEVEGALADGQKGFLSFTASLPSPIQKELQSGLRGGIYCAGKADVVSQSMLVPNGKGSK